MKMKLIIVSVTIINNLKVGILVGLAVGVMDGKTLGLNDVEGVVVGLVVGLQVDVSNYQIESKPEDKPNPVCYLPSRWPARCK